MVLRLESLHLCLSWQQSLGALGPFIFLRFSAADQLMDLIVLNNDSLLVHTLEIEQLC